MKYIISLLVVIVVGGWLYVTYAPVDVVRARMFAEVMPLFAIPGSNPDKIETALPGLEQTAHALAALQSSPEDAERVERALFPLSYLHQLVTTERARRSFVQSGTPEDEKKYSAALHALIDVYRHDLLAYREAVSHYPLEQKIHFASGVVGTKSIIAATTEAQKGLSEAAQQLRNREWCLKGISLLCEQETSPQPALPEEVSSTISTEAKQVSMLRSAFNDNPPLTSTRTMTIADKACVGFKSGPYEYLLGSATALPLSYIGDIYFYPIKNVKSGTFGAYLEQQKIPYSYDNVTAYYECPEIAGLFGRLNALAQAAEVLNMPMQTSDYEVTTALAGAEESTTTDDLVLAAAYKSAGLEHLIASATELNRNAKIQKDRGMGDFDAAFLLNFKSGFPLLFETQNQSFMGNVPVSVFEKGEHIELPSYSTLKNTYTDEEIVSLLKSWKAVHE